MRDIAEEIKMLADAEEYARAYQLGKGAFSNDTPDNSVLLSLYYLTAKLRSHCMGMAVRKADSGEDYFAKERLLRQINELTGEDMYGNRR